MARTPLSRGLFAIIDDEDEHLVAGIKWHAHPVERSTGGFYAVNGRGGAKPTLAGRRYMHRLILGASASQLVDHVNGDGLDNRRANLRIATRRQNNINRQTTNRWGFRGIERTASGRWRSLIRVDGRRIAGPLQDNAIDAALIYDAMASLHFGEFAVLNFPKHKEATAPQAPASRNGGRL
ncbi:putative endonuclease [Sphingobium sp. SYK-6]|uniref:HNH endonuclease n=1 Tax=Sphingobium sp. (strain NBRC 103272 / SYK-6) TaxID=627192 RepID=UPI00022770B1|nr:HNH endonuclease [Sphingobium sp. SYK-6]BAK66857.1 putative endonuclease [Sphingobium sp. SYK-6]